MAGSDDERDRSGSAEPVETTEAAPSAAVDTTVTPNQRMAMQQIVDKVYKHREKELVKSLWAIMVVYTDNTRQWP